MKFSILTAKKYSLYIAWAYFHNESDELFSSLIMDSAHICEDLLIPFIVTSLLVDDCFMNSQRLSLKAT